MRVGYSDQGFAEWTAAALAGTYTPISEEDLQAFWRWTQAHGPPNSYTGTTGHPAGMIRRLLRERAHLLSAANDSD